jgi:hypothetical protein
MRAKKNSLQQAMSGMPTGRMENVSNMTKSLRAIATACTKALSYVSSRKIYDLLPLTANEDEKKARRKRGNINESTSCFLIY